ncbi:unnamed protein product [Protopolystoma xenopodis]|uniref:Uncharacterized protein n=1 Tax=Protopolystoma xenopodis TaxID=117903 RepID=A0A448WBK2_9PLAT|nr:unnamed protein product [Protopolystoma xenopodis]
MNCSRLGNRQNQLEKSQTRALRYQTYDSMTQHVFTHARKYAPLLLLQLLLVLGPSPFSTLSVARALSHLFVSVRNPLGGTLIADHTTSAHLDSSSPSSYTQCNSLSFKHTRTRTHLPTHTHLSLSLSLSLEDEEEEEEEEEE